MTEAITSFPLFWPHWRPRTLEYLRRCGQFGAGEITVTKATDRLFLQLDRFTKHGRPERVKNVVVSSNLAVRLDGLPRSGQPAPRDPGVAVWFVLDGEQRCVPVDAYTKIAQNIAAAAAALESLRALERHGTGLFEAAFVGLTGLPHITRRPWWEVLGVSQSAPKEKIKHAYRRLRSAYHQSGDTDGFEAVQNAYKEAQDEY